MLGSLIFFSAVPSARAADSDFSYTVIPGVSSKITGYMGPGGAVTIPSSLGGYPVTSIDTIAFANYTNITSVIIPDSVTSIGISAFEGCTNLASVTIGSGLISLGNNAFRSCTSLTSVIIPSSVTSIGTYVFSGCTGLAEIIVNGSNLTYASENGVLFNKAKTALVAYPSGKPGAYTIPSSVTSISTSAFNGCSGLTSVTIPSSVTSIGTALFSNCPELAEIIVDGANATYASENGALFNKAKTALVAYPGGKSGAYVIPSTVTSVGVSAFNGADSLTSVSIPNSVTSIGINAFFECTGLTSATIGSGVTSIGASAFLGCTALPEINVDGANTAYASEDGVLFNKTKTSLISYPGGKLGSSYTIPATVTSLGVHAFNDSELTSIAIPEGVTTISNNTFSDSRSLVSVTIPSTVISIGNGLFTNCDSLQEITVADSSVSYSSEDGVLFNEAKTSLVAYPSGKSGAYVIPSSVTSIGINAFRSAIGLTSVTIPSSVTSIGNTAFNNCSALTAAYFLGNAPTLGSLVFGIYASTFQVHYVSGSTGFTSPLNIYVTEAAASSDALLVAADKGNLAADSIKGANSDLANILVALTNPLPSSGLNGSTIIWTSGDPSIVSSNGQTVVRPAFEIGDAVILMTATISSGLISDTKVFTLVVIKLPDARIYGGVVVPGSVGGGVNEQSIAMGKTGDIGFITDAGTNLLSYINSDASFKLAAGSEECHLIISDLDLFFNIIKLTIQPFSQTVSLKLGETARVDLNGDQVSDIEIKFANIWMNRSELTIRSLSSVEKQAEERIVETETTEPEKIEVKPAENLAADVDLASPSQYVFNRNLSLGATGADVRELQKYLNANGFTVSKSGAGSPGYETAYFGAATRAALIRFQKANKISPAVGYFGSITRKAINFR
jgi:hypothetical protein